MRYFQGFEGPIVSTNFRRMKIWIDKKFFANFTTFINISETRLPTSASLCQAGTQMCNEKPDHYFHLDTLYCRECNPFHALDKPVQY